MRKYLVSGEWLPAFRYQPKRSGQLKTYLIPASLVVLLLAPLVSATSNLNLSKSNINRYLLVYPTDLMTAGNAQAMLVALDKIGAADDGKVKQWLMSNFQRHGVDSSRVKKVVILRPSRSGKQTGIILLTDPSDEARATAFAVKSSKSNSSD